MTCFIITFRKCNENEEYRKKKSGDKDVMPSRPNKDS